MKKDTYISTTYIKNIIPNEKTKNTRIQRKKLKLNFSIFYNLRIGYNTHTL